MNKHLLGLLGLSLMAFVACTGTDPGQQPSLKVSPVSLEFAANGNTSQTVTVEAVAVKWTWEMSDKAKEWITVSEADNTLTVSVADNEVPEQRTGVISIMPDRPEMKPVKVNIAQEAGEKIEYGLSVNPDYLEFEAAATEPQEVVVTTTGEGLTWSAKPEQGADWVHGEASAGKIVVTVDVYEATAQPRSANIRITPSLEEVPAKVVRVQQLPAEAVESCVVSPDDDIEFAYNENAHKILRVEATCNWSVIVQGADGNTVDWINTVVSRQSEATTGTVSVTVARNATQEPRSGVVVIKPLVAELSPISINVTQGPAPDGISTLLGNVELDDMGLGSNFYYYLAPAQVWDTTTRVTNWQCEFWGSGITRTTSMMGDYVYDGTGNVLKLAFYSDCVHYNAEKHFIVPAETYTVQKYATRPAEEDKVPFTVVQGMEAKKWTNRMSHSWYLRVEDGVIVSRAPIHAGNMVVSCDENEVYTIEVAFEDDMGNTITGTITTPVTESKVTFTERPNPDEKPKPDPDPDIDPDPGFGQED